MKPMKMNINRGSHLPILMKLVSITDGPIVELGCGMYSTSYLHYACYGTKRKLVTYEHNPDYFSFLRKCRSDYHEINCIDNWDSIDLSRPWSIAFVDHAPAERREHEIRSLAHADYVVAHDTENSRARKCGYPKIMKLFKYRYKFSDFKPHTTVFSNKYDVTGFSV